MSDEQAPTTAPTGLLEHGASSLLHDPHQASQPVADQGSGEASFDDPEAGRAHHDRPHPRHSRRRRRRARGVHRYRHSSRQGVEISLIVPTRNEAENIHSLTEAVQQSLSPSGRTWELLFVDDSDDDTPRRIRDVADAHPEVGMLHREPGRRAGGLASAVAAGYAVANGEALVVIDGDLQHPPQLARALAVPVLNGEADLTIASRYVPGASAAGLEGPRRRLVSTMCTMLAHLIVPASRKVKDPLSGFFAVSRRAVTDVRLKPHGFKILLEVLARGRATRIMEVPFTLNERAGGQSKAGLSEGARFARHLLRLVRPGRSGVLRVGRLALLQLPLAVILSVQTWLSMRLVYRNTAFVDEATYLSAGHYLLHAWFHRATDMHFATYYSGAPVIYPPLAAVANNLGGLAGARYLSMGFMLVATTLAYAIAKRMWGRPAGWLAGGLFVTTQGTQFLGSFATYDAMALMLIAVGAWVVVRASVGPRVSSWIFVGVAALVFANATKYASALYDPVVLALAFFVIAAYHGARVAFRFSAMFGAFLVIGVTVALAIAPRSYMKGISSTTTNRAASNAPPWMVLQLSWRWIGLIGCLAAAAAVAALVSTRRGRVRWPTVGILVVCAGAVWLAPLNQARIDTATSLSKHVTFGAWFGAVAGGWLFSGLIKSSRHARRVSFLNLSLTAVACAVAAVALVPAGKTGTAQAQRLDSEWSNSAEVIGALRPLVDHAHGPILMDNAEVARYYLEDKVALPRWVDTFYYAFTPPGRHTHLVGNHAYTAAVDDGVFSVIALDYGEQIHVDRAIAAAVHSSGRYSWVGDYTGHDTFGRDTYVIWKRKT